MHDFGPKSFANRALFSLTYKLSPVHSLFRPPYNAIPYFQAQLSQMEDYLPRPSGRYLKTILGSVNMSILDKEAKYQYKEQYEQFKLIVMLIGKTKSKLSFFGSNSYQLINIHACSMFVGLVFF